MSGGDKLDFEIRPNPRPGSRRRARRAAGQSGIRPDLHRPHGHHPLRRRQGLVRRPGRGARADPDGPGDRGAALRAGDLRGAQGVPRGRRRRGDVPAGGQRRPVRASRPSGWRCRSCRRPAFLDSLRQLIEIDREWIPTADDGSLYLRPFMFASEVFLGVRPANGVPLRGDRVAGRLVLRRRRQAGHRLGLAGLHPGGARRHRRGQVRRQLRRRRWSAQAEAIEHGCDQVVFLDAVERRYVDELGGMNIFFVYDDGTLVTPPLTGTILPGITRDSMLTLAREAGRTVVERPVSFDEWQADAASGRLREVVRLRHRRGDHADRHGAVPGRRVHRRRRRPGRGHHRPASAPGRHPARPGRRPVRLGPPRPLSSTPPSAPLIMKLSQNLAPAAR